MDDCGLYGNPARRPGVVALADGQGAGAPAGVFCPANHRVSVAYRAKTRLLEFRNPVQLEPAAMTQKSGSTRAFIGAAAVLALMLAAGLGQAEHGGGGHGQHGGDGGQSGGMGHGGHQGKGHGKEGGGGHGKHSAFPGMVQQVCHDGDGMPPHYCAPSFKVMSSVPGLQILDAGPVNDRMLWVKLSDLSAQGAPFARNIAIVGGGGGLAGATTVGAGWQQQTTVRLALEGDETVWSARAMHLHAFPLTGP